MFCSHPMEHYVDFVRGCSKLQSSRVPRSKYKWKEEIPYEKGGQKEDALTFSKMLRKED